MNNDYYTDDTYCSDLLADIKKLIDTSVTTSIIGVPGVGISIFLKYLSTLPFAKFIYIDVFGLPDLTTYELFKDLLAKLGGNPDAKTEGQLVSECNNLLEIL